MPCAPGGSGRSARRGGSTGPMGVVSATRRTPTRRHPTLEPRFEPGGLLRRSLRSSRIVLLGTPPEPSTPPAPKTSGPATHPGRSHPVSASCRSSEQTLPGHQRPTPPTSQRSPDRGLCGGTQADTALACQTLLNGSEHTRFKYPNPTKPGEHQRVRRSGGSPEPSLH